MDPQSVSLVLDSFHALLCHEILGELLTDTGVSRNFVSSLKLMFLDEDWDVRDAAIQFVGSLFKEVSDKRSGKRAIPSFPLLTEQYSL